MPWTPDEMRVLRRDAVMHLFTVGRIVEDQLQLPDLFTCDLCTEAEECEWVYHYDNIKGICVKEEVANEEGEEGY